MNIAVIGTRGLPATWGGVERHVEEIGARLVDRGHQVTVFTRPGYPPTSATATAGCRCAKSARRRV